MSEITHNIRVVVKYHKIGGKIIQHIYTLAVAARVSGAWGIDHFHASPTIPSLRSRSLKSKKR